MSWYVPGSGAWASLGRCVTIMLCSIAQQVPISTSFWMLWKRTGLSSTCLSW